MKQDEEFCVSDEMLTNVDQDVEVLSSDEMLRNPNQDEKFCFCDSIFQKCFRTLTNGKREMFP